MYYSCTSSTSIGRLDLPTLLISTSSFISPQRSGIKRLARISRKAGPSDDELRANLARAHKRMYIPTGGIPSLKSSSSGSASDKGKRLYIPSKPVPKPKSVRQHARDIFTDLLNQLNGGGGGNGGGKHHGGGNGGGGAAGAGGAGTTTGTGTGGGNGEFCLFVLASRA